MTMQLTRSYSMLWTTILIVVFAATATLGSRCKITPLSARTTIGAETIISASVTSFYLNNSKGPFSGKVKVRRVFRGDKSLEGRSILVNGFGSKYICVSTPRLGDTKLFFLDSNKDSRSFVFDLQSSILRMNLRNLKVLWALEKANGNVCQPSCQYGASCHVGKCVCMSSCAGKLSPVCGYDGKTYNSRCELKLAECETQRSIGLDRYGSCASAVATTTAPASACPPTTWRSTTGCRPCRCTGIGSDGGSCDPTNGECVCKAGYTGPDCTLCSPSPGHNAAVAPFYGSLRVNEVEGPCREPREVNQVQMTDVLHNQSRASRFLTNSIQDDSQSRDYMADKVDQSHDFMADRIQDVSQSQAFMADKFQDGGQPRGLEYLVSTAALTASQPISIQIFGTIGSACMVNSDCNVEDSVCKHSVCECREGYIKDSPMSCRSVPPGPCSFSPCESGGTCEEHDGTFTCYCSEDRVGKYCERPVPRRTVSEAGFIGTSLVVLKYLPSSITRTSMEFRFRTFTRDGVLLLARQREDGLGDFFSLAVVGGHLELRYDLGSGPVSLTSLLPLELGKWHHVTVKRYRKDAQLRVDGGEPVQAKSKGRNKSLNLKGPAFIGGLPTDNSTKISRSIGTFERFQGCITDLKLQGRSISLSGLGDPLIDRTDDIMDCGEHPCQSRVCLNGGQCRARGEGKARCECSAQFRGRNCQKPRRMKSKRRLRRKRNRQRWSSRRVDIPHLAGNKNKYKYQFRH